MSTSASRGPHGADPGLQSTRVIRKMLLHVPIVGAWVERRWMPDPVERDRHRELVQERLHAPTPSHPPHEATEVEEIAEQQ